jgi:prepilin-type N-terminal cleavage/methylation domain-containing protein
MKQKIEKVSYHIQHDSLCFTQNAITKRRNTMFQKMRGNKKGFTLIELMIVIAIIGILAAIAIPNFIAYRNKAFCSQAESDAKSIAGDIADYFAIPTHTAIATGDVGYTPSGTNTFTVTSANASISITITVTDGSGRCPADYQAAVAGWDGNNIFTEVLRP